MPEQLKAINKLTFSGDRGQVETLRNTICSFEKDIEGNEKMNPIDFNKIAPMPAFKDLFMTTKAYNGLAVVLFHKKKETVRLNAMLQQTEIKAAGINSIGKLLNYLLKRKTIADIRDGKKAYYNHENFGHYDSYHWSMENWEMEENAEFVESDDNSIKFKSFIPPIKLIQTLSSQFPEVKIDLWFSEGYGLGNGKISFKNGVATDIHEFDRSTCDAVNFAFEMGNNGLEELVGQSFSIDNYHALFNLFGADCVVETALKITYDKSEFINLKKALLEYENYELINRVDELIAKSTDFTMLWEAWRAGSF